MRTSAAILAGASCFAFMSAASAQQSELRALELQVSQDTLQLRYLTDAKAINVDRGQLVFGGFLSEDRDVVGTAGLMIPIDLSFGPISFSAGAQAYAALLNEENNDVFAISVGAQIRYLLNENHAISVVGSGFYSPDVFTFGSADNVTDLSAWAEAKLADHVIGLAGYRWFDLNLAEGPERKLQDQIFIGVRWVFH